MIIKSVNGKSPLIPKDCYVAENATIVGDVVMGNDWIPEIGGLVLRHYLVLKSVTPLCYISPRLRTKR